MASFWTGYAWPTVITAIEVIVVVVPLLLAIAMLTYAERKVLAYSQLRKGPNVVGPFGLLQPFADGLKLLVKETIVPSGANRVVFVVAPLVTFTLALVAWAVGFELALCLLGRAALGRADGVIRGCDRFCARHRAALCRLAEPL
jgi:NADH-quinone oxidoreductase subunit H